MCIVALIFSNLPLIKIFKEEQAEVALLRNNDMLKNLKSIRSNGSVPTASKNYSQEPPNEDDE